MVVLFNPWWFSGQESLAKAFLGQLQAVLPAKYEGFKAIGDKLAEFAGALGGATDLAGAAFGIPLGGKVIEAGAKLMAAKPKDVPALKKDLSSLLLKEKKRVLVIIDDIDRLAPDEVRQLFTVIKALADFPYVTYLLAFDREVAAAAINEQTGLPGERYLEKIIQVPFELPRPDRVTLRTALFKRLDGVMASTPDGLFDSIHWSNIFHSGLDPLVRVPRDAVRLCNVLSVTYPAVVGEVNPVDFIAIESLRVFLPGVYDAIRDSPEEFVGPASETGGNRDDKQRALAFHAVWLETVPAPLRESTKDMLQRLFPRLESVWSNTYYTGSSLAGWRRALRICAPDIFPTYFKLSLPQESVSRSEITALMAKTSSAEGFSATLRAVEHVHMQNGESKASALLDRFLDYVDDLPEVDVPPVIEALFTVGDELLLNRNRTRMFGFGEEANIAHITFGLLKKVQTEQRVAILGQALERANALRCSQYLLRALTDEAQDDVNSQRQPFIPIVDIETLKSVWCKRVAQISTDSHFIDHPSVAWIVHGWKEWGSEADAVAWWQSKVKDDDGLLKLIKAIATTSRSQSGSDLAWRIQLRVDPRHVEPYADPHELATRVQTLWDHDAVAEHYRAAVAAFLRSCDRMKQGKNPDSFDFHDE